MGPDHLTLPPKERPDMEELERFNRRWAENLDREKKMIRHYEWRGAKLPPMNIEPFPHERYRLVSPMSEADRALRKQWVMDQKLAPHEPVHIPALEPKNIFRRMYSAPWNAVFDLARPTLGKHFEFWRLAIPRSLMAVGVFWAVSYQLTSNAASWESDGGWHMCESKGVMSLGDDGFDEFVKEDSDFYYNRGFLKRKVFLENIKTSTAVNN